MKAIFIREEDFEEEFKTLLSRLELELLKADRDRHGGPIGIQSIDSLHRKFVYELHQFKTNLENR